MPRRFGALIVAVLMEGAVLLVVLTGIFYPSSSSTVLTEGILVMATTALVIATFISMDRSTEDREKDRRADFLTKQLDEFYSPLVGYFSRKSAVNAFKVRDVLLTKGHLRMGFQLTPMQQGCDIHIPDNIGEALFLEPENSQLWEEFLSNLLPEFLAVYNWLRDLVGGERAGHVSSTLAKVNIQSFEEFKKNKEHSL